MTKKCAFWAPLLLAFCSLVAFGQTTSPVPDKPVATASAANPNDSKPAGSSKPAQPESSKPAQPESSKPAEAPSTKTSLSSSKIPSGSKVYVAPMGGFENYVIAGILKKKVPVTIVSDRDKAEYEIRGSAETEKAGWAKMLFMNSQNSNEQASINVSEIKTGNVVFAYSVNKMNSVRGKQSAGEAIGKHLNEAIGKD